MIINMSNMSLIVLSPDVTWKIFNIVSSQLPCVHDAVACVRTYACVCVCACAIYERKRGEKIGQRISLQLLLNTLHFGNTNSKSQCIKGLEL